ncbi:MAG: hypothetical protein KIS80_01375 [Anaerolineales bacterium]|nr:hypothetical protein [Anaerolineales bacterium]
MKLAQSTLCLVLLFLTGCSVLSGPPSESEVRKAVAASGIASHIDVLSIEVRGSASCDTIPESARAKGVTGAYMVYFVYSDTRGILQEKTWAFAKVGSDWSYAGLACRWIDLRN